MFVVMIEIFILYIFFLIYNYIDGEKNSKEEKILDIKVIKEE